jgi:hypothetical protein
LLKTKGTEARGWALLNGRANLASLKPIILIPWFLDH